MPMACTVCPHPERESIDRSLATGGANNRAIARRYGLSKDAVRRHAATHLPERLAAGARASDRSLRERVEAQVSKLEALSDSCWTDGGTRNGTALLQAADRLRPMLELLGRATRELQPESTVTVQIALWQELGVRDKDEALHRIEASRAYDALPEAEVAARLAGWLGRYLAAHPEDRDRLLSTLLPYADASVAEDGPSVTSRSTMAGG